MTVPPGNKTRLAAALPFAARSYWFSVFPLVRREIRHWRARAEHIPDPTLRGLALETQRAKRGNVEGAAAFATFLPSTYRAIVIRIIAAYQTAFDYLDTLAEQPNPDPITNGRQLNQALLAAVEPAINHPDYYAHYPHDDGGYLESLVNACVTELDLLPSFRLIAEFARRASTRIVEYQTYNHGDANGSHLAFDEWSQHELDSYDASQPGSGLRRWELSAAAGSSLPLFALIAAASKLAVKRQDALAIEQTYYPWVGAVNSLLDSLVDQREDTAPGQNRLFGYYNSNEEMTLRLTQIVTQAARHAERLPKSYRHTMIFMAMASFYLSSPDASLPDAHAAGKQIRETLGSLATPMIWVFGARRILERIGSRPPQANSRDLNTPLWWSRHK
jgi:tetraprenyl-beta-curcumene synthase